MKSAVPKPGETSVLIITYYDPVDGSSIDPIGYGETPDGGTGVTASQTDAYTLEVTFDTDVSGADGILWTGLADGILSPQSLFIP